MLRVDRIEGAGGLDRVLEAGPLFDDPPDQASTREFLADRRHHLLVAYMEERPAGFLTGIELLLPDKPRPEMFLYEIGVAEEHRRKGVGRALVEELLALCRERGCGEMFVLTDPDDPPAHRLYASAGGRREPDQSMFGWDLAAGGS